jgi:hypothetical protein
MEVIQLVIQSNMSAKAVVEVWKDTLVIFEKYNVPLTEKSLESSVNPDALTTLLKELNAIVGSSAVTCIEGG